MTKIIKKIVILFGLFFTLMMLFLLINVSTTGKPDIADPEGEQAIPFQLNGEISEDTLKRIELLPSAKAGSSWVEFTGDLNSGKITDGQGKIQWIKGRQDLVSVGDGKGGVNGGTIVTGAGAQGAIDWARAIAEDNTFNYGDDGTANNSTAHTGGCYFCNTNKRKKAGKLKDAGQKWSAKWDKTYCCNPFTISAYAHGANDPKVLALCKKGRNASLDWKTSKSTWKEYNFQALGKPKWSEIQPGDICFRYGHQWMVTDPSQDLMVEATGGGWDADSIYEHKGAKKEYGDCKGVVRYVGNGPGGTSITSSGGGISGTTGSGIQGALNWAKKIADDNSYTYKQPGRCHTCHSSVPKTYCCASFVVAAFAHGAGDSKVEKLCKEGHSARVDNMRTNLKKTGMFEDLGKLSQSKMQPGDVLIYSSDKYIHAHTEIYVGNGQEVGAHGKMSGISVRKQGVSGPLLTVLRYKGGGGATANQTYDKNTVIKTLKKSDVENLSGNFGNGKFPTAQAMAYMGNEEYAVVLGDVRGERAGSNAQIIKWKGKKRSGTSSTIHVGHGNGLTHKDGTLYVAHGNGSNGTKVNGKTLKKEGTFSYNWSIMGIGYDKDTSSFTFCTGGNIFVTDADMKTKKQSFRKLVSRRCQDQGAARGIIYNVSSNKSNHNQVNMYSETTGDYFGSYKLDWTTELESVDVDEDGRLLLLCHQKGSRNNYVYRTKDALALTESGTLGNGTTEGLTIREDIRVLVHYKKTKGGIKTTTEVLAANFKPDQEQLQIANQIAKALSGRGYSQAAIAGVIGNLCWESGGLKTYSIEKGGGGGHGLAQWTGGRWTNLQKFASSKGKDWTDLDLQIEFLCHELDSYKNMEAQLRSVTDVTEATKIFMDKFERPGIPAFDKRVDRANAFYGNLSGAGSGTYTDAEVSIHIDLKMMKAVCKGTFNGRKIEGAGDVSGSLKEKNIKFSLQALAASSFGGEFTSGQLSGMRTTYPEAGNKWYFSKTNPYYGTPYGPPAIEKNCTWYAWGRFCEIAGRAIPELSTGNGVDFYDSKLEKGDTPRVGALAVWGYGSEHGAPGHVAVVEEVKANGDVVCSNSGYSGEKFWMSTHKKSENYSMHHRGDVFRGFVYQPGGTQ